MDIMIIKLNEVELSQLQVLQSDANEVQELLRAKIVFWLTSEIKTMRQKLSKEIHLDEIIRLKATINTLIVVAEKLGAHE